jgi:hypothetical protein
MFFIEWWLVRDVIFSVVAVILCGLGFALAVRIRKHGTLRIFFKVISGGVGMVAVFLIALTLLFGLRSRYSIPVFSATKEKAVRVRSTSVFDVHLKKDIVELYTRHGLRNETLFVGELGGVQPASIKWISDSEVVIPYSGRIDLGGCTSTPEVKVVCAPMSPAD